MRAQKAFICDDASVESSFCETSQIGQFILNSNVSEASKNPVITQSIHLKDPEPVNYPVKRTGYYCVGTYGFSAEDYRAVVEFRNAYGELQAAQIAKLPFYGGLTIVYAVMSMYVSRESPVLHIDLQHIASGASFMFRTATTYVSLGMVNS